MQFWWQLKWKKRPLVKQFYLPVVVKLSFLKVSAVCMSLAKCQTKMSEKGGGGAGTRRGKGWGGEQVSSTSATTGDLGH